VLAACIIFWFALDGLLVCTYNCTFAIVLIVVIIAVATFYKFLKTQYNSFCAKPKKQQQPTFYYIPAQNYN
jgi:hypothetical protein